MWGQRIRIWFENMRFLGIIMLNFGVGMKHISKKNVKKEIKVINRIKRKVLK